MTNRQNCLPRFFCILSSDARKNNDIILEHYWCVKCIFSNTEEQAFYATTECLSSRHYVKNMYERLRYWLKTLSYESGRFDDYLLFDIFFLYFEMTV